MSSDCGRFAMTFKLSDYCLVGQDAEFKPLQFHFILNKDNLPLETVIIPFFDEDSLYIMNSASVCSQSLLQCRNREFDAAINLEVDQGNPLSEQFDCINNPSIKEKVGESYSGAQKLSIVVNINTDEFIVNTCTFTNCKYTGYGGAIDIELSNGGKASVINSQFTGCQTNIYGGAIYASIQSGGILTIDGQCKFTQCTAQNNGGGIFAQIEGENSKLIIRDGAIFDTCSSQGFGGGLNAMMNNGAQLTFQGDCQFQNCSVNSGSGGGIYASVGNEGSLIQCLGELTFDNCSSLWSGGGASLGSWDKASIEINKVTCIDCKSEQSAGLNVQPDSDTYFTISGKASFTRCESTGSGGGLFLYIQGENAEIQLTGEMEFIDCFGEFGGGLSIYSSQIISVISSSIIFQNCSSTNSGGGLYLSTSGSQLSFTNIIQFKNCSCQYSGGGLWASCIDEGTIQFIGGMNFENCSTNQQGGAIYAIIKSGGVFNIDGQSKFNECTAQFGGGIIAQINGENSKLIIGDGAIFDTCSSDNGGGLFAMINSGSQLIFEGNCQFIDCSSSGSGGGLGASVGNEGSSIRCLGELTFDNCSSTQSSGGGAFFSPGDKASIELTKVTCIDCKSNQGGGIEIQFGSNSYFAITDKATFTRCESTGSGGGLNLNIQGENAEIQLTGEIEFIDCIGNHGGGISFGSQYYIILVISNTCTFRNCTGTNGGELSFINCTSSQRGGGLYALISQGAQ
ncbi:MAG: hypothetical protein EZS28_032102, partial [Streblomastix strix]